MKLGLALGGGGVRGLAHISVLDALDELGVKPSIISGSSMGAIVGAIYASGIPGKRIKERLESHWVLRDDTWRDVIEKRSDLLRAWRLGGKSFGKLTGGEPQVNPGRLAYVLLSPRHMLIPFINSALVNGFVI